MSQVVVMLYKDPIPKAILAKLKEAGIIPVQTKYLSDVSFRIVEVPSSNSNQTATSFVASSKVG